MAEGTVRLPPDSSGKRLRTQEITSLGPDPVEQEVVTLALSDGTLITPTFGLPVTEVAGIAVDANNSTTTPLAAGATFTGTATNILAYSQINVALYATPSTAKASFYFEFSPDGTNWDVSVPALIRDPTSMIPLPTISVGKWFRVRYLNDGGASAIAALGLTDTAGTPTLQTAFRFTTYLIPNSTKELTRTLDQIISGSDPVVLTRTVQMGKEPSGTYRNFVAAGSSSRNSTTTLLGSAGVFTGTFEDVSGHVTASILVRANQPSATDGVVFQFSTDGTTVDREVFRTYDQQPNGESYIVPVLAQYLRIKYFNGGGAPTGTWVLETRLDHEALPPAQGTLESAISSTNLASMSRSLLVAANPSGSYGNMTRSTDGGLLSFGLGYRSWKTSNGTVGTTVQQILNPGLSDRVGFTIKNEETNGANDVLYLGSTVSMTSSADRFYIPRGATADVPCSSACSVFVIGSGAAIAWSAIEVGGT